MIDRQTSMAMESGEKSVICAVCEALPADERKRLRDDVMTRDLRRASEDPARASGSTRAGKPRP